MEYKELQFRHRYLSQEIEAELNSNKPIEYKHLIVDGLRSTLHDVEVAMQNRHEQLDLNI